jgi:hypothetical protein
MRLCISRAALAAALTFGAGTVALAHMGGMSGTGAHAGVGMQGHGFGFHRFVPTPTNQFQFHQPRFNFGRGFRSRSSSVAGGYGDSDDDISELHFRVQEPFGPGDIGRPPVRAEGEDAPYGPEGMGPGPGYDPRYW